MEEYWINKKDKIMNFTIKISRFKDTGKWYDDEIKEISSKEFSDVRQYVLENYRAHDYVVYWLYEGEYCPIRLIKKEDWS